MKKILKIIYNIALVIILTRCFFMSAANKLSLAYIIFVFGYFGYVFDYCRYTSISDRRIYWIEISLLCWSFDLYYKVYSAL